MMMFRNSDWSRAFLAQLSDYAHLGEEALLQMRPVGEPGTRISTISQHDPVRASNLAEEELLHLERRQS